MTFYERVSGSRLHANYFRAGGAQDMPRGLDNDIFEFTKKFPKIIDDLENLLTENRILSNEM